MKMTFDVKYLDGLREGERITAHPRSIVAFERTHKVKVTGGELGMTELMWIAWHAGGSQGSFDAWIEGVDEIDPVDDDEGGAPFETQPSGE